MTTRRTKYDFSEKTKRELAKRAGHRCSNPSCNAPTSSKNSVGEAAHIYSAFRSAARYNSNLSVEDYCDISNGIHLCANCHNKIDKDRENHPAELLRSWKAQREENASKAVGKSQPKSNALVYKQELKIVFDRFEQRAKEASNDSDLISFFCEEIIPFLHKNKPIEKILIALEAQFDQLHQSYIQKEQKALEEVNKVDSEIMSVFVNDKSEKIQRALKIIEEENSYEGSSLYEPKYTSLKELINVLLAEGHVDFCKKYCILNEDNTRIEKFTFAPTVLEADKISERMRCRSNDIAIIWYHFREAHKYWHIDASYFENPDNFKNMRLFDRLAIHNLWYEIFSSRPENITKYTQCKKIKFNKNLFINGLKTLITHIYTNL